jgi:hypothetical protein
MVHVCPTLKLLLKRVIDMPVKAALGMTAAGAGGGLSHPQPACAKVARLKKKRPARKDARAIF